MIRLLLDQGLPRSATDLLKSLELDAVHVGQLGMHAASDIEIISYARTEQMVIATLNGDFNALLALGSEVGPSVIRLRLQRLKAEKLAEILRTVVARLSHELEIGCFVTVTAQNIRLRRLPIRPA